MRKYKYDSVEWFGISRRVVDLLAEANEQARGGDVSGALLKLYALFRFSEDEEDDDLKAECIKRIGMLELPSIRLCGFYDKDGPADDVNTPPSTSKTLPPGTPIIFKPNLNPDKIYEDLFEIKNNEESVSGIPFWFVVHNFFESINWLEVKMDTKFIAWVRYCFGWEWKRGDFKRISPRFKNKNKHKHFEEWPKENQTDKNYCALSSELRSTYQKPKPDGDWEDKDIYYKKNRKHYN